MINNTEVLVTNLFPNLVATKNLNLSNFKVKGKNFKKTFESNIKTTLNGSTLFDKDSINYLNLEFNLKNIIFCLLISLISQFGDLFISFLKRKANLKDTGNILPGHGGALDRVDGIIFAVPFSYFLIKLF